mgnify:CR=1 FL=1
MAKRAAVGAGAGVRAGVVAFAHHEPHDGVTLHQVLLHPPLVARGLRLGAVVVPLVVLQLEALRGLAEVESPDLTALPLLGARAAGAAAIDGQPFVRIEAVGKNLFAFFGKSAGALAVVHIHFGMAGVWSVFDSKHEEVPPTTATTRLLLEHESGLVSHLSAMTVTLGTEDLYRAKRASLGEDPLRDDADADLLFDKVARSGKKIGELLMDQSFFCGPGNIYRAEILFKAGVHPNILGRDLGRDRCVRVRRHTVALLSFMHTQLRCCRSCIHRCAAVVFFNVCA